jgi:hypothetical protein
MQSPRVISRHPRKKEPLLWIVDSEQWPRAYLRAELIERGYDPYGFIALTDALEALSRMASPKPDALILELRGQTLTIMVFMALMTQFSNSESYGVRTRPAGVKGRASAAGHPMIDAWNITRNWPSWLGADPPPASTRSSALRPFAQRSKAWTS